MKISFCRSWLILPAAVAGALLAIGCQETGTQQEVAKAEQELREQQQEARQEIRDEQREGVKEAGELQTQQVELTAAKSRDEFVNAAEQKLADAKSRIEQLELQASTADAAHKEAMDRQVQDLRNQHDRAEKALGELKSAETSDWQTHQQQVRTAMQDLDAGLSRIR